MGPDPLPGARSHLWSLSPGAEEGSGRPHSFTSWDQRPCAESERGGNRGGKSEGAQGTTPAPTRFSPMGCKAHGATSIPGGTYTPSSGSALPAPYPKSPRAPCSLCFPNAPNPARGSWQTGHREVSPLPGICGRATRLILSFPTGTRGRAIRKPDCLGAIKPGESGGRLAPTRTVPLHRIDMQRPICCPWGAPGALSLIHI